MGKGNVTTVAETMHKAGFPPWLTVVVLLATSPGFYEFFFDDQDEVAEAKAEVGYEITRQSIESLRRDNAELRDLVLENQRRLFRLAMRGHVDFGDPAMRGLMKDEIEPVMKEPRKAVAKKKKRAKSFIEGFEGEFSDESFDELMEDVEDCEGAEEEVERVEAIAIELPPISAPSAPVPQIQQAQMPADLDGPVKKWLKKKAAATE